MTVSESLYTLMRYVEGENYKGYDPYDTLTGWVPFHWLGKWGPVLAMQFQKRNPVNIRPFLGVKKDYNPKAMGLFLHAYSLLYQKTQDETCIQKTSFLFDWLRDNASKGYTGCGWGYNFPWANPEKYLQPYVPSAVVTGFVCRGLYEYYKINTSVEAKELIKEAALFIRSNLPRTTDTTGTCISYTPIKKDICFNASLLAAEVLALNHVLNGNEEDGQIAHEAVRFVIARQKENGLWAYSVGDDGRERLQTDFHQGYVLESIYRLIELFDAVPASKLWQEERAVWLQAIKKGCKYYRDEQFTPEGRSFWRVPKKWPVEIHNQAQGIITFTILKDLCPEHYSFSETIADWTVRNMQHPRDGYFFYQKFPTHTHKIPYMRWSQAWMMLALSELVIIQ